MRTPLRSLDADPAPVATVAPSLAFRIHRLPAAVVRFSFARLMAVELRLMIAGSAPWWVAGGAVSVIAGLVVPARWFHYVLLLAWIWPVLHWSAMGNREVRHETLEYVFSAAHLLRRQFAAL